MAMRAMAALVTLLILAGTQPATAYVPEKTPVRAAEAAVRAVVTRPAASGTTPGILVMRGQRELIGINAGRALVPASLMKLATTTAAMVRLGPSFRFRTTVRVDRRDATVGTLSMVGGGDPTLATESYRRGRFLPKARDLIKRPAFASGSPTVEQLAAAVVTAGIRHVTGDLIADDSIFDARRTQPGWRADYTTGKPDVGFLSGLTLNEGRADPEGTANIPSPTLAAGRALRSALAARGVTIDGTVRRGRAAARSVEIAHVSSPPLTEIIDFVDRYSINYEAEQILKFMGDGVTTRGVGRVRATLAKLGVPLKGFVMADGSGLSLLDRMSPRTLASILRVIMTSKAKGFDTLRAAIPVAGRPGTLQRRMRAAPTGGNLRGKTGQIRNVRAMAGWVTAADGVPVIYVAMFNRAPSPFALTSPLDLFGLLLARLPDA